MLAGIEYNKSLAAAAGITYKQNDSGEIITNPSPPLSEDMDYLYGYEFLKEKIPEKDRYLVVSSRGCNYDCSYCGLQVPYRLNHEHRTNFWRARSAKKIVDEIGNIVSMGIDKFSFYCEQFFSPGEAGSKKQAEEIANEILKRRLKIRFSFITKAAELLKNFDSLFILKEAGMENVDIGIDSGLERFHKFYRTGSGKKENIEVLKRMHRHGFNFDISFIFFDPYLTIDEIKDNITFLETVSGYFSHLQKPFSAFLEPSILNSVLILRHGMPIIEKLKQDGLAVDYPDFSKHPEIRFKDPRVKKIHEIFTIIEKNVLPSIRHYYIDKAMIEQNGSLALFPLRIMEKITNDVVENRVASMPKYLFETAVSLKKTIKT